MQTVLLWYFIQQIVLKINEKVTKEILRNEYQKVLYNDIHVGIFISI